jgi:hypothetical protein
MHTFELRQSIKLFFTDIDRFQPFIAALAALAQSAVAMESNLPGLAAGGAAIVQWGSQIHSHLVNARQSTSTINQRQFFKALEQFQHAIGRLHSAPHIHTKLISDLDKEVDEFASVYDAFLSIQSAENAVPLLLAAKVLQAKIGILFDTLQFIEEAVGEYDVPSSSEAALVILLPASLNLTEFARRLTAIQTIYTELCMLLSVSENTNPLRVSKIESGSLWVKVFGEAKVIGMMVSFLEKAASWIFGNFTKEGKIASIPRKVESIEMLLRLTERLNEAGMNTSEMKPHIEKSAIAISRELAEILDGQSSVTVNERTVSVGSEISRDLIERTSLLQLPSSGAITNDTSSAPPQLE